MKKKHYYILIVIYILWIFSHSLATGDLSSAQSGHITNFLLSFLQHIHINISFETFHYFIRKLAHFSEYAILGMLVYHTYHKPPVSSYAMYYFFIIGIVIPAIDETIQLFTVGRNGSIYDVLLDLCGYLFGGCIIYLISHLYHAFLQKHDGK